MTTDPKAIPAPIASPLYDQIVQDFLARAEKDVLIPASTVKRLKAAFAGGSPKPTALVDAFSADDDLDR